VTAVLSRLAADFRSSRSGNTSADLRSIKLALDRATAKLSTAAAPADAAGAQRLLVQELRDYASQIDLLRASVDFGDIGTIASHLRELTAPTAINRTLDTLAAKGYHIPVHVADTRPGRQR
jgi:hypothetical protein